MLTLSYLTEFAVLLSLLFILLYLYFTRNFQLWKRKNVPYVKPVPFFGNFFDALTMRHSMGEIFVEMYRKLQAPVVGLFILDMPCLLIRDVKLIRRILVNDFQYFSDRNVVCNKRDDPLSAHITFVLKNPEWKEVRAKVSPVFTSSKIKFMSKLVAQSGAELVDYLDEATKRKPVVEVKELCAKFTVDVISSAAFGVDANCFKDENSEFRRVATKLFDWDDFRAAFSMRCYFLFPKLVYLLRLKLFNPVCTKFLKKCFLDVMDQRAASRTIRNDLIDILLQMKRDDSKFMEGDILIAQAIQFFGAGYETTSTVMSFALYELARNPEIQDKLRREIDEVSKKHSGINFESIKEMEYLDMCFKESLRMYPPLPFLDRQCKSPYKIPETDVVIDKGISVFISILGLHYDPKYFPEPKVFRPERFSKANEEVENFTYLPFGDGPRNCIGARFGTLSAKSGLAHILQNFTVNACEETQKEMKFEPKGLLLSPINGIKLKLTRVNKSEENNI